MIKKFIFPFVYYMLLCDYAITQTTVGPELSLNFSTVTGGTGGNQFKLGFSAGFFLRIGLSESSALRAEVLYSTRGYKQNTTFSGLTNKKDTTLTHNFSYIDIPLLFDIEIGHNGFIHLGSQIGYIANAEQKGTISVTTGGTVQTQSIDTSDIYGLRPTEYAIVLGGGYKFNFPLVTSLRFTYGLSSVYEDGRRGHNLIFQIFMAYSFGRSGGERRGIIYRRVD